MKSSLYLGILVLLFSFCEVFCGLRVESDGSLTVTPPNGQIMVDADRFILSGRDFVSNLNLFRNQLQSINQMNMFYVPTLRFQQFESASTRGTGFTIGGSTYYVTAGGLVYSNGTRFTVSATLNSFPSNSVCSNFQINGQVFVICGWSSGATQWVFTPGSGWSTSSVVGGNSQTNNVEFFSVFGKNYLALATAGIDYVYERQPTQWSVSWQTAVSNANDCKYFVMNGTSYLAFASVTNIVIYQLLNATLSTSPLFQTLTVAALDLDFFTYNGFSYLLAATTTSTRVFKSSGGQFFEINPFGPSTLDLTVFWFYGGVYVATQHATASSIYLFNPGTETFAVTSSVSTSTGLGWSVFKGADANTYAFLATSDPTSFLYKFDLE